MTQTQTPRTVTPFEAAILRATSVPAGIAASFGTDAAIRELLEIESHAIQLGGGAPSIYDSLGLTVQWSDLSTLSIGDA